MLGIKHAEAGDFSKALRYFNRALELEPKRAEPHELKAQALLEAGQFFPAIKAAEEVRIVMIFLVIIRSSPAVQAGE